MVGIQAEQPYNLPHKSEVPLFVLMVKAVCGESCMYGLEGGKIPNKESTYPYLSACGEQGYLFKTG